MSRSRSQSLGRRRVCFSACRRVVPKLGSMPISLAVQKEVGLYFRLGMGEFGEIAYRELERDKDSILAELPESAQWRLIRGFHSVAVTLHVQDVWADANRATIRQFFAENVNAFVNAFRRRMQRIAESVEPG